MTTSDDATGGSNLDPGGNPDDGSTGGVKHVPYDTYDKAVKESKARQAKLKEIEAENARLKALVDETSAKDLEAKGEYKKLLDAERERLKAIADENEKLKSDINSFNQLERDRRKLAGLTKHIGPAIVKYQQLVDFDTIAVNPETGEIDEMSLQNFAERFKKEYPEIAALSRGTGFSPNMPGGNGQAGIAKIRRSDWQKLPTSAEMKKWKPDQIIDD